MTNRFLTSLQHASRGIKKSFAREPNLRIHTTVAACAIILSIALHISPVEWGLIILTSGMVISLEIVNSAVEKLVDHLHPAEHGEIAFVKDVLAGAVLVAAICAILIAAAIFLPHLLGFLL